MLAGRHVASIFEKLGFDPQGGQQLFVAVCEALMRLSSNLNDSCVNMDNDVSISFDGREDSDVSPRGAIIDRPPILSSPEKIIHKGHNNAPTSHPVTAPNAALASAFGKISLSNISSEKGTTESMKSQLSHDGNLSKSEF